MENKLINPAEKILINSLENNDDIYYINKNNYNIKQNIIKYDYNKIYKIRINYNTSLLKSNYYTNINENLTNYIIEKYNKEVFKYIIYHILILGYINHLKSGKILNISIYDNDIDNIFIDFSKIILNKDILKNIQNINYNITLENNLGFKLLSEKYLSNKDNYTTTKRYFINLFYYFKNLIDVYKNNNKYHYFPDIICININIAKFIEKYREFNFDMFRDIDNTDINFKYITPFKILKISAEYPDIPIYIDYSLISDNNKINPIILLRKPKYIKNEYNNFIDIEDGIYIREHIYNNIEKNPNLFDYSEMYYINNNIYVEYIGDKAYTEYLTVFLNLDKKSDS